MLKPRKEVPIAYLLWFLFGPFGGHKFYLGQTSWGVLYFFTGGLFFVGWIVDFFTIPLQVERANLGSHPAPPLPEEPAVVRIPEMRIRSTFPINDAAIARQALRQIMTDPITWVPMVPAVAAYTIFNLPALLSMCFGAIALAGVGSYWRRHWSDIVATLRRTAIVDHNRAQDAYLKESADDLRRSGLPAYANRLEKFLVVKRLVERRMHEDGELTPQKVQIEKLVDAVCFGVRDQLTSMAARERNHVVFDQVAELDQIETAFVTLKVTADDLDTILGPDASSGSDAVSLEEVTRRLQEEAEIARRVQARLREKPAEETSAPPQAQQGGLA